MAPKGTRSRGGSTAAAVGGRASSRIAEKQEAAQQLAQQGAAALAAVNEAQAQAEAQAEAEAETEAEVEAEAQDNVQIKNDDARDAIVQDSSMGPPAANRGRGRNRGAKSGEAYARRGTRRGSRGGSSIASFQARNTPATSDVYALQQNAAEFQTPHRVNTAPNFIYVGSPFTETSSLTPRTQDVSVNLMNKFVDGLLVASKDLMSHLTIEDRDESWTQELHALKDQFNNYYKYYSLGTNVFIDVDDVREKTKADETPIWPRMSKSIATANLASLWSDVEDLNDDPSNVLNRLPLLQRIDDHFPVSFIPGGRQGLESSQAWLIDETTNKLAFQIRTQRFIETLRGIQQVSPFRLFAKVFLDLDVDNMTDDMLGEYIQSADFRKFDGFDIQGDGAKEYRITIDSFRALLTEMDPAAVISKLEQIYAFQPFLVELKDWVRSFEARTPGVSQPLSYNGDGAYTVEAQLEAEAQASQQGRFALSGVERIRQLQAAAGHQAGLNSRFDSDAPDSSFDAASLAGTDIEALARAREMPGGYGLAGIDGALYAASAADQSVRSSGRKRNRRNANDSPNAKRARGADADAMPPPPLPAVLGGLPHGPVAFDPVALSRQSQLISKANRRPAVPKQRKPWTAHDTRQLVQAVDVYKAKWSTIEKAIREGHIPFNVPERDQQGLRDKARLVKVDLLKTDADLPPAFDLVVLGRKEKDMVIAAGRNPERREADVADGHPINTLYDPNAQAIAQNASQPAPQADMDGDVSQADAAIQSAEAQQQQQQQQDMADGEAAIQALQEAPIIPEAPIGGAPDAPMMATAEMDGGAGEALVVIGNGSPAPPSESLGEEAAPSVDGAASEQSSLVEAGPSSAAVNA